MEMKVLKWNQWHIMAIVVVELFLRKMARNIFLELSPMAKVLSGVLDTGIHIQEDRLLSG
jgi:hypothetical protein